ncbi:hypothetical protein HK102_000648 [Quaeritorhiza haematococci]|nr:hypothetical protein HK102_000648 [Quaeritorhiza haematococci]
MPGALRFSANLLKIVDSLDMNAAMDLLLSLCTHVYALIREIAFCTFCNLAVEVGRQRILENHKAVDTAQESGFKGLEAYLDPLENLPTPVKRGVVKIAVGIIQICEDGIADFPLIEEGEILCDGWHVNTSLDMLEAACRELQKANPDSLEAAICMIKCHELRGRFKEATDLLIRMIPLHPNAPFLYYAAAEWNLSFTDALSYCKKGVSPRRPLWLPVD